MYRFFLCLFFLQKYDQFMCNSNDRRRKKHKRERTMGPFEKGYLVLIEHQGVEGGQPRQSEVVPKQVVVHHQLLQLSELFEARE